MTAICAWSHQSSCKKEWKCTGCINMPIFTRVHWFSVQFVELGDIPQSVVWSRRVQLTVQPVLLKFLKYTNSGMSTPKGSSHNGLELVVKEDTHRVCQVHLAH